MAPTIPRSFTRLSDGAYPIPEWHDPDPALHAEVFADDPPAVPPGYRAVLAERPDEQRILRYSLEPIPLDELRAERLAELAEIRYAREIGGTAYNGWPLNTDRASQGKAVGAYAMASNGLWPTGSAWKFADGVARALTAGQVQQMALSIAAHVQACFDREAALAETLRASLDPLSVDLMTGWPA